MNTKSSALAVAAGSLFLLGAHAGDKNMAMGADLPGMEKCYGVAKVAMNDCGTATHGCAGLAAKDRDPQEWLYLPKGICEKLAGGSLKPGAAVKPKAK